jgi:hypothetical protein
MNDTSGGGLENDHDTFLPYGRPGDLSCRARSLAQLARWGVGLMENGPEFTDLQNFLSVSIVKNGRLYSSCGDLPDVALAAEGPQSLESGVMTLVRELCQRIRKAEASHG